MKVTNQHTIYTIGHSTHSIETSGCEKTLFFLQFPLSKRIYLRFMPS